MSYLMKMFGGLSKERLSEKGEVRYGVLRLSD